MPSNACYQNVCERCGTVWYDGAKAKTLRMKAVFTPAQGKELVCAYDILCGRCSKAVARAFTALAPVVRKRESAVAATAVDDAVEVGDDPTQKVGSGAGADKGDELGSGTVR